MLRHLRLESLEGIYGDPNDGADGIDDPCTYCGEESVCHTCPGDGRNHHHGACHGPDDRHGPGYIYLCRNPECRDKLLAEWRECRGPQWRMPSEEM